jgi:hypothetical protein
MRATAVVIRVHTPAKSLRGIGLLRPLWAVALGSLLLVTTQSSEAARAAAPEEVVQTYLTAVYAREYGAAYDRISLEDRKVKTKEEYLRENGAFSGAPLELARTLASLVRFENTKIAFTGDRATVTGKVIYPNANDPAIQDLFLEFDEERLADLSPAERAARVDQLRQMARSGRLPVIVGEHEQWELIREDGSWRVFLNWAGAVIVRFEGITQAGLPWDFTPVQPMVRAKPGETLQTFYWVKNLADRRITGKARHIMDPPEQTRYLEIVTAFCFLQQTLNPAEGQELPVVFRVNPEIPESIREIRVRYEFYPLDRFPSSSGPTSKLGSLPENP